MNNFKVFLCGITQNSVDDIDKLTKDIYKYFDGLIWVDHQSTDGTKELLESRKSGGEIVNLPWMNNHGWSMQACLNSNKIVPGDFIFWRDTKERVSEEFAFNIKEFCWQLQKQNINSVFSYGKLLIFRYFPDMFVINSPHWFVSGLRDDKIEMSRQSAFLDPKSYAWNARNDSRPKSHWIEHFLRYYYNYKISNHLLLGREQKIEEYHAHEEIRQRFIVYCQRELGIGPSINDLLEYWKNNILTDEMKRYIEYEKILNDAYCYYILKHSLEEILKRQDKELYKIL